MTRRRRHRFRIALVAIFGLLFQQLAVAGYECKLELDAAAGMTAQTEAVAPCHVDQTDAARCNEHCHPTVGSAAHAPAPDVPPCVIPPSVVLVASEPGLPIAMAKSSPRRPCATSPPLSIQFCSLQI